MVPANGPPIVFRPEHCGDETIQGIASTRIDGRVLQRIGVHKGTDTKWYRGNSSWTTTSITTAGQGDKASSRLLQPWAGMTIQKSGKTSGISQGVAVSAPIGPNGQGLMRVANMKQCKGDSGAPAYVDMLGKTFTVGMVTNGNGSVTSKGVELSTQVCASSPQQPYVAGIRDIEQMCGAARLQACLDEAGRPLGALEAVDGTNGKIAVRGWVVDPSSPSTPSELLVTIDNTIVGRFGANTTRTDVRDALMLNVMRQDGRALGFDVSVPWATGDHTVCVKALNLPGGPGSDLGLDCKTVRVTPAISAFVVDGNSQVATRNWDAKAGWSPWYSLLSGSPVVGNPTVVGTFAKGRVDVFARNSANQLIQTFWTPQSGWTQWFNLGGTITSDPAVFYNAQNNDYFVYARGANGQLVQRFWDNDWSPWFDLGGVFEGTPAVVGLQSGAVQHVFVRNAANEMWQTFWTPQAGWSPWYPHGGSIASEPTVIFDVAANDLLIFARGTNGNLVQKNWNDGWSPWYDLGGVFEGKPAVVGLPAQGLQVFVRNSANQLWQRNWNAQGGWTPWYHLGGSISSDPTAIFDANTRETQVYARGTGGSLVEIVWQNGWSPWYDIGGWLAPNRRPSIIW